MLVLNHAGDWTALVNRSDTDILVEAFANLARARPDKEFIIRAHPTMAQAAHEGVNSIERLADFVTKATANLSLSRAALSDDLTRGDLYLSEYSQVLLDVWAAGKLGAAVNLTGRRSFMADYEQLGFAEFTSDHDLRALMERIDETRPELVSQQNRAVERFNTAQHTWALSRRISRDRLQWAVRR